MIKLCAIDLDGTLFDKEKRISEENIKAINDAKANNVKIVIATGRPINGVKPVLELLGLTTINDYVICYNGAKVYNVGTNETVFESSLDSTDVKTLYSYAKENNIFMHAFTTDEELLATKINPYTDVEARINRLTYKEFDFSKTNHNLKFIKMMLIDSKETLDKTEIVLPNLFREKYNVVRSAHIFLEFLNKKSDKGLGLEALRKHLNLNADEIMAIGDAGNDISLLDHAYVKVAMANSFKELLPHANFITKSNTESGVAYAINKFILTSSF